MSGCGCVCSRRAHVLHPTKTHEPRETNAGVRVTYRIVETGLAEFGTELSGARESDLRGRAQLFVAALLLGTRSLAVTSRRTTTAGWCGAEMGVGGDSSWPFINRPSLRFSARFGGTFAGTRGSGFCATRAARSW